jgi:molybdopterin-guanine dinucleotide biosynthesis protein B
MAAPDKFALIVRWGEELSAEEIATRHMSEADVVVCEGFKRSALPKIEIFRTAAHREPLFDAADDASRHYLAIVADGPVAGATVPIIALGDAAWLERLADLVERRIMNVGANGDTRA